MRLFKEYRLATANAAIATFGKQRVLVVALLGSNRHYLAHGIQRRHFNSTAKAVGYGADAEPLMLDFIARTPAIVEKVRSELPVGFSEKVADKILGGLLDTAAALERMPPT